MCLPPHTIEILSEGGHEALYQQVTPFFLQEVVWWVFTSFTRELSMTWAFSLGIEHDIYLAIKNTTSSSLVSSSSTSLGVLTTWIEACIFLYFEILTFYHNLKLDLLEAFHLI